MNTPLSPNNPKIKRLARLIGDRRFRHGERRLVVDGPRALGTFVEAGGSVECVFTDDPVRVSGLVGQSVNVEVVERDVLDRISDATAAQGILGVAVMADVQISDLGGLDRLVILDGVQEPGNVGAVIRVGAAVGAGVLCCVGTADPFSPRAVRASAGTVAAVDVVVGVEIDVALRSVAEMGFRRIGATMGSGRGLGEISRAGPIAIVLGNEGAGLAPGVLALLDEELSLPMRAPVESLNVAVTAGVILYGLEPERI